MLKKIANFVGFDVCWFALVLSAAGGVWGWGIAAVIGFAAITLYWGGQRRSDLIVVASALLIGLIVETTLIQTGLIGFESDFPSNQIAPLWMLGLWANFALTLNHSLAFLKQRLGLAAVIGAALGPFAYYTAGEVFGAAHLSPPMWQGLAALALAYAIATPLLLAIAQRFESRGG